jgi:hypothetical protein
VLATLTTVTAVMIVVVLVYCAGTRCRRGQLNYNSPFNDKSGEATNDIIIAISQFPSSNPDTAIKDSSTHSVGSDSPSEKANLPLNQAIDDREENPNDELGIIPSPNVTENVSYQPSTRFSLERNVAYGTDIAIAPEIETTQNIAYEHSNSTI